MVGFRIDKDTPDYITMDRNGLLYLSLKKYIIPNNVYQEVSDMIEDLVSFEYSAKKELEQIDSSYLTSFKIRKESALGQYLIENAGKNEIINESEFIHYSDVVSALNIALFNEEDKTSNKIFPLFKEQISGSKKELLKKFPEWVLNYILENNDFDAYLAKRNQEKPIPTKSFVVYEEGEWTIKNLEEDYIRVPKKA